MSTALFLLYYNGISAPFDSYYYAEDPQDKIFKIQRRIITKFAQEGPCVIVGRCANYILEQADIDSFDVFIRANIEKRMANVSDRVDLKGDELVKFLQKRDQREEYIIASILRENGAITTITT